jgi:hypothetical protein
MTTTVAVPARGSLRRVWLVATLTCTLGAFVVTIALAPPASESPTRALQWLLFVASSMHVASTGWFFTVAEVRRHARLHASRYVVAPAVLLAIGVAAAVALAPARLDVALLAFFGWQFFHFQKQNLGMAALAGVSVGAGSVTRLERVALLVAGCAGIGALLVRPQLLQLHLGVHLPGVFVVCCVTFAVAVLAGGAGLLRRPAGGRPGSYAAVYLTSLLFFLPVFVFANPYAAVAGLVVAHGGQYLVIVGLVAAAQRQDASRAISLGLFVNIALVGGLALNAASHLHGAATVGRVLFGVYLGATMAHFVVDAGLWRLRDEFPRTFLRSAVPYLLDPRG